MAELGTGLYTFGRSIKAGVYDVKYVSGNGCLAFDGDVDESQATGVQFYNCIYATEDSRVNEFTLETAQKLTDCPIHIEAANGLRMLITNTLVVSIEKAGTIEV